MTATVIQTQSLTKQFGNELALRGVDLEIHPGQTIGLIGTNGSGKSTLIKCLLGLLRRTSGSSSIFQEDSWNLGAEAKSRLGYVSQEFQILPWMKVRAMCDYTGAFYEKWDYEFVLRLIREWDLPADKRVGTLSVGQRQKLAVILAMGHRPELLILDEPVASLDPVARRQFLQALIEFSSNAKNTFLFSTHITSDLERVASHVAFLRKGELSYFGELDALKENCKRLRVFAPAPLPGNLQVPGALRSEIHGQNGLITLSHLDEETIPMLRERFQAQVSVEDLNLEEIFLELNGFTDTSRQTTGAAS